MSAEILESMIQEERAKAKELEKRYAEKLREHNVSVNHPMLSYNNSQIRVAYIG